MTDGIRTEDVTSVETPRRARVDDAETATERLDRKKDCLGLYQARKSLREAGGDLHDAVVAALKEIYDPEIPVNIYDLGLIYNVEINDGHALVTMTLTTPHCPVAESMPGEVELRVGSVPGIGDAEVNLVWDPPWSPAAMTDEARLELGML